MYKGWAIFYADQMSSALGRARDCLGKLEKEVKSLRRWMTKDRETMADNELAHNSIEARREGGANEHLS